MTRPQRFLTRMIVFLVAIAALTAVLSPTLAGAYLASPALNTLILAVMVLGIAYVFRQVVQLRNEVVWLEAWQAGRADQLTWEPQLLGPMARMIGERRGRLTMSALAMRSLLDGIATRLDERKELSRYLIGLLIFLGLLGTFWGLLETIQSVSVVISSLSVTQGDVGAMFGNLQRGLQAPLTGMGTAFSASLFGLAGSLILGFLELQASQAQNRFYNDLEDLLSSVSRLPSGAGFASETGDAHTSVPAYLQALLETTAENLESLQRTVSQSEEGRRAANQQLYMLTERIAALTDHMKTEQTLLLRVAEGQLELRPILARLVDATVSGFGMDDGTRQHIRNLDIYMARLVEEVSNGRAQSVQEIRSEIKLLARTIVALSDDQER
jgi:hypothetical protein